MLKEHPAYQEEITRFNETKNEVEKAIETYTQLRDEYKRQVQKNLRQFKHNPDEGSQLYIELMTGTTFVQHYNEKLRGLERSLKKPYFARIDFTPDDTKKLEKCYIGKTGLMREPDNFPIIIDWRAPISTVYYEGRLGEATYTVPDKLGYEDEVITGNLSLKRQFTVEESELLEIFDIDLTTNDPLLQKALGANADNRLKDIASTIQAEQNRIIRAELKKPLIVQGVAGSGKTTIALHRIAYLIYNYAKVFDPDTFMIIAPNMLFLDYISAVLPELGVERVKQTTYIEFMLGQLGQNLKVDNPNTKLTSLVNHKNTAKLTEDLRLMKKVSKYKGSMEFKALLDSYLNDIEENFTPTEDLKLDNIVLVKASEIRRIFLNEYKYHPIYKRISKIKNRLKRFVKKVVSELIEKEKNKVDTIVEQYYLSGEKSDIDRSKILKRLEERDRRISSWSEQATTLVDEYLSKLPNLKLMDYYLQLISNLETMEIYSGGLIPEDVLLFLKDHTISVIKSNHVELEDLAPLVYMKSHLYGLGKRLNLSHVVIDEAQDFSLFQFYIIKQLSYTKSFTILGDLSQGIHAYRAIENWSEVAQQVFAETETTYSTLEQSYRTTIEIMNLANEIIKNFHYEGQILAKPIIRHGELPAFKHSKTPEDLVNFIYQEVALLQSDDIKSVAIICKTMEECQCLHEYFPKENKPLLITEDMTEYVSGVLILPSYLAKGLEFDAVFIIGLEEEYLAEELDIKLLYIAMTRALHKLYICSIKEVSPIIKNVPPQLYHIVE